MSDASARRRGRVLIAKIGLDGHESGAKLVGRLLRDAGFEVIYTGLRGTVPMVVRMAEQEDVDLIGVSLLSGTHMEVARDLRDHLRAADLHIPVMLGGVIPPGDVDQLLSMGVSAVFGPGSYGSEIVDVATRLTNGEPARSTKA